MKLLSLASIFTLTSGHNLVKYPPTGLDYFEAAVQRQGKELKKASTELNSVNLNLRVAKAIGSKGYDSVRISAVSHDETPPDAPFEWEYSAPFKGRWTSAFSLGESNTTCSQSPLYTQKSVCDADCILFCSNTSDCNYYNFDSSTKKCSLYDSCDFKEVDDSGSVTYQNFGKNYLHSAVVEVDPGQSTSFKIGDNVVEVLLPKENGETSGIVWSDPCIDGRWVGCQQSSVALSRSVEMLNALSEDPTWHFFQILGDNFYDQDGRLTHAVYDGLSLKSQSKLFMTVPGNHDLWVAGGPDASDSYDQFGHGFMQWYGQDTVASTISENGFLDFSIDADDNMTSVNFNDRNSGSNFLWYNKVGSVGFMGFNGASLPDSESEYFSEACAYFENNVDTIYILGHWDASTDSSDYNPILGVPELREMMLSVKGCNIGDKLKFMDGHTHSNYMQQTGTDEPVGFMIGGHGMSGAGQYGFAWIKNSGDGENEVYYFEEFNTDGNDHYDAILSCVKRKGVAGCTKYATKWL